MKSNKEVLDGTKRDLEKAQAEIKNAQTLMNYAQNNYNDLIKMRINLETQLQG